MEGETSLDEEPKWTMTTDGDIRRVRFIGITLTMLMLVLVHLFSWKDVGAILPVVTVVFVYQAIIQKMARSRNTHPSLILTIATYHGPLYMVLFFFLVEYTIDFWKYAVDYDANYEYPIGFVYARADCVEAGAVAYINRNFSGLQPRACKNIDCSSAFADNATQRDFCDDIAKEVQIPYWLRVCPGLTPVAVWLSFFISLFQMCRHARAANRKDNWDNDTPLDVWQKHDVVVSITLLPTIYGLLSFKALLRSIEVIYTTFSQKAICYQLTGKTDCDLHEPASMEELQKLRHTQVKMYEADFAVADLYEAFMLLRFSYLKFTTIKYEHNLQRGSDDDLFKHILTRAASSSRFDHAKTIQKGVQHRYEAMLDSTEGILNVCVYSFVISCCLQTCFALTALGVFILSPDTYEALDKWFNKGHYFLLGIGFVASTLAIYAIIKIEVNFHTELKNFNPWWKFLTCKILVSLAFLQEIICFFPIVWQNERMSMMTDSVCNMFYACCLCYESALVSLLCLKAWRSSEMWYKQDLVDRESKTAPLLQVEGNAPNQP